MRTIIDHDMGGGPVTFESSLALRAADANLSHRGNALVDQPMVKREPALSLSRARAYQVA